MQPELHGLLQSLRFERPPLGGANAASIRKSRWPAGTKMSQTLAGCPFTDAVVRSQLSKAPAPVEMLADQSFSTDRSQAGIRVCRHEGCGLGLLGRTTTLSASHPFVSRNNLVERHT